MSEKIEITLSREQIGEALSDYATRCDLHSIAAGTKAEVRLRVDALSPLTMTLTLVPVVEEEVTDG